MTMSTEYVRNIISTFANVSAKQFMKEMFSPYFYARQHLVLSAY